MAKCAVRRPRSQTRCIKPTRSSRRSAPGQGMIIWASRRARRLVCSQHRAPKRLSSPHSQAFNNQGCRNNPANRRHIRIYNRMAPRMQHRRPSWPTRCVPGVFLNGSPLPRHTPSRLPRNSSPRCPPYRQNTAAHLSRLCSRVLFHTISIHNLAPLNHPPDRLPRPTQWPGR